MKKFRLQISVPVLLLCSIFTNAQNQFSLHIHGADKDSATIVSQAGLQVSFPSYLQCADYANKLTSDLQSKGYVTASIDKVRFDSSFITIDLFLGERYQWALLDTKGVDNDILDAIGWNGKVFAGKPINFDDVQRWEGKILDRMENTGYPFARIYLDSLQLDKELVSAQLKLNKGPLYKIDSIRLYGNAKISNHYLQRYLELPNGSIYSKGRLLAVNKKLRELSYVEQERPFDITMLGTGSVLNLYLKQKKSSQINALIGFLPNNDQLSTKKILITGEANILLRNALGGGETIGLNWQQVQVKSPRLSLLYQHPYILNSPVGLDFSFDMFRKDSSFLNINFQLGANYILNSNQSGRLFLQRLQTIVNEGGINTAFILQNRRLPDVADVSSFNVGFDYEFNNTDYRLNPKKGNELRLITTVGSKKLKKNNQVLDLKDPSDPSFDFGKLYDTVRLSTYQFRIRLMGAHYWPLGNQRNTIKTAVNAGMFQSGNVFRNELFQIGGYKLLRGFDEESQYLSHFVIGTVEYHYLVGQNSYFYVLADGGWGRNNTLQRPTNYTYIGTGLGLAFETKAGIFNLAWAVGKRNDTPFNLRQSKIHIGFVNYF